MGLVFTVFGFGGARFFGVGVFGRRVFDLDFRVVAGGGVGFAASFSSSRAKQKNHINNLMLKKISD